jgi:four helix bundle protein
VKIARSFRDLEVFKLAFKASLEIREITRNFPPEERFTLSDQIRRSSRSVCTHIGEGWALRSYPRHFVSKISVSRSEATETRVHLDYALSFEFIDNEAHRRLDDDYDHISAMLFKMIEDVDSWCSPASPD